MPKPQRAKPKPPPYWERDPRPIAGGLAIIGHCQSGQGIPLFIEDVISNREKFEASIGLYPPCRHCGRRYLRVRAARRAA